MITQDQIQSRACPVCFTTRKLSWLDIAMKHHANHIKSKMICDEHLMYLALFSYYGAYDL